jgi:hypothetical protein
LRKSINWKIALGLGVCLALIAGTASIAADAPASEYAVKAAIIHKIAKFVTWPAAIDENPTDGLSICLPDSDPIGPSLEALSGEFVHGRIIVVRGFT